MIDTRHRRTALLIAGCFFMEMLDGTIVSTAAPQLGAALHTTAASVGLVITAYLLTVATLIPLSGWLTAASAPGGSSSARSRCSPSPRWPAPPAAASACWSRCGCCRASAAR